MAGLYRPLTCRQLLLQRPIPLTNVICLSLSSSLNFFLSFFPGVGREGGWTEGGGWVEKRREGVKKCGTKKEHSEAVCLSGLVGCPD